MKNRCKHPFIKKLIKEEFSGKVLVSTCCVAHYFPDGSLKPSCIRCPDCGEWISWEEQQKLKEGK